jgi:short-subunit dehydrogenase
VKVCCLLPGATATGLYDPNRVNLVLALRLGVMHKPEFVAMKSVKALYSNSSECTPGILNKIVLMVFPIIPDFVISVVYGKSGLFKSGDKMLG